MLYRERKMRIIGLAEGRMARSWGYIPASYCVWNQLESEGMFCGCDCCWCPLPPNICSKNWNWAFAKLPSMRRRSVGRYILSGVAEMLVLLFIEV